MTVLMLIFLAMGKMFLSCIYVYDFASIFSLAQRMLSHWICKTPISVDCFYERLN
ncbi:hypothetical protein ACJX0J_009064, partial [Zea mays]